MEHASNNQNPSQPEEGQPLAPAVVQRPIASTPEQPLLTPRPPVKLSAQMRALLGPSIFRQASDQIRAEDIRGHLMDELKVETTLQALLADQMADVFILITHNMRAVVAAVDRKRLAAAREILCPPMADFYPPPHGAVGNNGYVPTAYGEFLEGARSVIDAGPDEVIAAAIAKLAEQGMPETALDDRARVLAMDDILSLEKVIAAQKNELKAVSDYLFALMDRRAGKKPTKADKTSEPA